MDNNLDDLFFGDDNGGDNKNGYRPPNNGRVKVFGKAQIAIIIVSLIVALVGVFVIGLFVGQSTYKGMDKEQPLVNEVYELMKQYYIEDVTDDDYDKYFAAGLTTALDRYTGIQVIGSTIEDNMEYGIAMSVDDYSVKTVTNVKVNSVSAGIVQRGDIILETQFDDGEFMDVKHYNSTKYQELIKLSRSVAFKIDRDGVIITTNKIVKGEYTSEPLACYRDTARAGIGYIRLESFDVGAADDFMSAIYDFELSGNNVLILDIRDNPGGGTDELTKIVRNFIAVDDGKSPVIKVEGKGKFNLTQNADKYTFTSYNEDGSISKQTTNNYIGDKIMRQTGKPFKMVLVANGDSASAAEAFVGNILHYMDAKDYLLLGEDAYTFGKGIAQSDFRLKSKPGLNLHMTIGKYTVLGKRGTNEENEFINIHGKGYALDNAGIKAEIKVDRLDENAIVTAIKRAELAWGDILPTVE